MTKARDTGLTAWRKSSECVNGECVEIAHRTGTVLLRHSGAPGVLEFTTAEWSVFVRALARGEFGEPDQQHVELSAG